MDTEHLAAVVAAFAIFVGVIAPSAMLAVGLCLLSVGLIVRARADRAGFREERQTQG